MQEWYAARILTGKERIIQFYADQALIPVFFPQAVELKPGHREPTVTRLFPGYAFFQFDIDVDWWYPINNMHGVVKLLPVKNENPCRLPPGFVDELKIAIMNGEFSVKTAEDIALKYVPGDLVPVIDGTWAGFTGSLVKHEKGSLQLLLSLFGRRVPVPIPAAHVAPKEAVA